MVDAIVIAILAAIAGGIIWYLLRAKKRGDKCVGCPHAKLCRDRCSCSSENSKRDG